MVWKQARFSHSRGGWEAIEETTYTREVAAWMEPDSRNCRKTSYPKIVISQKTIQVKTPDIAEALDELKAELRNGLVQAA